MQLFGGNVKNPKVLQDLQKESEALKRYLIVLEERQLEEMIQFDEAKKNFESFEKKLSEINASRIEIQAALKGELISIQSNLTQLSNERKVVLIGISKNPLAKYEVLRKIKAGIAVTKVIDTACASCGSTLNSSLMQVAKSPNQLSVCDACSRILFTG